MAIRRVMAVSTSTFRERCNMLEDSDTPTPHTRKSTPLTAGERVIAQNKFLRTFSMTANVRASCMVAKINRSTVYYWQEHDEAFSFQFEIATQEANDLIR